MRGRSRVLDAVLDGQFPAALEVFASLLAPTPEDERWAAYSEFSLGQALPARDRLLRLVTNGHAVARVELATVYRLLGDAAHALDLLDALPTHDLCPFDRTLAQRERGACLLDLGRYIEAEAALERAWMTAQHEVARHLRPSVAYALGYAQSLIGRDLQARHHLNIAVREAAGGKRLYPLLARAYANTCLLQVEEAEPDLQEAEALLSTAPVAAAVLTYTRAALSYAQGRWEEAGARYEEAGGLARELGDRGTQVFAALGAAASFTASGASARAALFLGQVRLLAITERARAHLAWREGTLRSRQGGEGSPLLEQAGATFERLGLWREAGSVLLHQAEAHFQAGRAGQGADRVAGAVQVRQALGRGAALLLELRALPRVQAYLRTAGAPLRELANDLDERTTGTVELVTLGDARVLVDGEPVRFQLRRVVEVLTYLLRFPQARFEQVSAALFPEDAVGARGYFHQVRTEVAKRVPGLRLAYDRASKTYSVETTRVALAWDAGRVRESLAAGPCGWVQALQAYRGPFLPEADSEWARTEREALELALLREGLAALRTWRESGEHEAALTWSRRLLELDPLDVNLVEAVLEATQEVHGPRAARLELARMAERFRQDVGEVPTVLKDWAVRLEHAQA